MSEHSPTRTPILEATRVDRDFGTVSVLEEVSLTIESDGVTALIGPNGSGKTTLLRVLAGLLEPTDGTIDYHGADTVRHIGYLPQQPAFRPGFTVLETLRFYSSLAGETEADALDRLRLVGLEDATERPVEALSGGMTRLVGIAQATIGDPPVVVLDEPGSGLDPGMRRHVFEIATELAADGTAVILSSHDLELVERTADDVVVIEDGQVLETGEPATLCDRLAVDSLRDVYEVATAGEAGTVRVQGVSS